MSSRLKIIEELSLLQHVLQHFPEGALAKDIANQSKLGLDDRTFQRRLMKLKETGLLRVTGKGRSTRYHLNQAESAPLDLDPMNIGSHRTDEELIPLSANGREVLQLITRPLQKRSPVGYNRLFLENYQPNKTHYLTQEERNTNFKRF